MKQISFLLSFGRGEVPDHFISDINGLLKDVFQQQNVDNREKQTEL